MAWRVEALHDGVCFRAAAGAWLYEPRSELVEPVPVDVAGWPGAVLDASCDGSVEKLARTPEADAFQFDYDLLQGSPKQFHEMLQNLVGASLAGEIAATSRSAHRSPSDHRKREPLAASGMEVDWVDFPVVTVSPRAGWHFGVRTCWIFVLESRLVTAWGDFVTPDDLFDGPPSDWDIETRGIGSTLPAMRERLTPDDGASGGALFSRFLNSVLTHQEWSLRRTQDGLVRWDGQFLMNHRSLDEIRRQTDELARIGQAIVCLDYGSRAMARRGSIQPVFSEVDAAETVERSEAVRAEARATRGDVRESFALAGQAVSAAEAAFAEERAIRTHRFEFAAGVVTAFVLVPGLVVGVYGANVEGLPGQGNQDGLLYLALLAGFSGIITILLLVRLIRRDPS